MNKCQCLGMTKKGLKCKNKVNKDGKSITNNIMYLCYLHENNNKDKFKKVLVSNKEGFDDNLNKRIIKWLENITNCNPNIP